MDTGKLVAGPFECLDWPGSVRFSDDSKKLAVMSYVRKCLEVWDVQTQKLDGRVGNDVGVPFTSAPIFWTNKNKNILAPFTFTKDPAKTIYEFDALTLKTVGAPFEGHTERIISLALSSDSALLASASEDDTIKLWAFESRQLLASFDVQYPFCIVLSPNSRQLAYVNGSTIDICNIPPDILASIRSAKDVPTHPHISIIHVLTFRCRPLDQASMIY